MSHRSRLCHFVIDVDDLDQAVTFWAAALDAIEEPIGPNSRHVYRQLRLPDSDVRVLLQHTTDPKAGKERMHLDLETNDVDAKVRRLEQLGATRHDHQQLRASTSGYSATPGTTSSASSRPRFPTCSPAPAVARPRLIRLLCR